MHLCKLLSYIVPPTLRNYSINKTQLLAYYYALVTCEIKLFSRILKLFQCFISHVTMPETEIKLSKEF